MFICFLSKYQVTVVRSIQLKWQASSTISKSMVKKIIQIVVKPMKNGARI